MGIEIERKFLVQGDGWRGQSPGAVYRQGYVLASQGRTVRVRVAGTTGFLTLKGGAQGLTRKEFEYEIPLAEAEELLLLMCDRPLIEKTRYHIPYQGLIWEVDEFAGENAGLILAEVELTSETQTVPIPDWIGTEVSSDPRYYNAFLSRHPFRLWGGLDS
ncbi:MAG: CYTH domain-containing protein [Kaiparowitsia implicata GSE-PSE-MK54-09C]|jgi:CYTH domain-containing protein|nr:CYTH domain-containing protein [Kaiparowitsia implicata GSE-PSE-MK54-09C]